MPILLLFTRLMRFGFTVSNLVQVGLLSLFEHYQSCRVGERLKCPARPVWLVCSESHFSLLWSSDPALVDQVMIHQDLSRISFLTTGAGPGGAAVLRRAGGPGDFHPAHRPAGPPARPGRPRQSYRALHPHQVCRVLPPLQCQCCTAAPGGREPPWTGTGPSRYYDQQPYSLFVFLDINNIQHGFIICCDGSGRMIIQRL